ncbi:MAG: rod shape-determining protein RodA [Coriobacteriia bacterium]|nr:rod shape-determining protein RodA [Coriobacteriia bacterium]MCL2870237.1 rod shape-determining protein RodA [Coriobacteriia bacterium]
MIDIKGILNRWVHPALLVTLILVLTYGAIFLQTAVRGDGSWARQMQGVALGLILMAVVWLFDYRKFEHWLLPLFALNIFLLVSPRIPFIGREISGATRWIGVPGVDALSLQPSEPAKIVTIVLLAAIISRYGGKLDDWRSFAKVVGLSLIPFFAVMTQPDLGTGLVFLVVMIGMLFLGGAKLRYMAILILSGIVAIAAVYGINQLTWSDERDDYLLLRTYQLNRLAVFWDQGESDPMGAGYDLNQSKIAIGSGGITGKGMGEGTQSQLDFISERATDYIFSVLGEELGFVGAIVLIGLYIALLVIALSIGASSSDLFGTLICGGIVCMWAFQIMQNIGMTMGLMPITGIPLPFMSYGLSAIVTNILACGLLLSVWSRRPYQAQTRGGAHDITI